VAKKRFYWSSVFDCVLQEKDQSGNTQVTYTHEPSTYGPLVSENRGGQERQYHFDALGSTRALTNATESVTDTFAYDAWGSELGRAGTLNTPYRWIGLLGYYFDVTTGMYYIRVRTYRPQHSRWLSIDPVFGTFTYSSLSPAGHMDASGLSPEDLSITARKHRKWDGECTYPCRALDLT